MYNQGECQKALQESVLRLRANYGADKFPKEKCDLIWEELRHFSPKQIRNICSLVMGEANYAPNINSFREKCSLLREKIRQFEKEQERQEVQEFWNSKFQPNDVKMMTSTIKDRIHGKCDDKNWLDFIQVIKNSAA